MNLSTTGIGKTGKVPDGMYRLDEDSVKRVQKILLASFNDIQEICEREGLDYYLGGGSCLGAVRHQGFIPWDDDLDINMSRDDYKKLADALLREHGDKYIVLDCLFSKSNFVVHGRIRLKDTKMRLLGDTPGEDGITIDVFKVDNVPDNAILRNIHSFGSLLLGFITSCRKFAISSSEYLKLAQDDEGLLKTTKFKIAIGKALGFTTAGWWARRWDKWNALCKNSSTKCVTVADGRMHYIHEMQKRSDIYPTKVTKFENTYARIPNNPDPYLKDLYGDYMTIPPKEKREDHLVYAFDLGPYDDATQEESHDG